jgi:Ca-activated chloride channel family protein
MNMTRRFLAPLLILAAVLAASPLQAKPLVGCDLSLDRTILPAGLVQKTVIKVSLDVPAIPVEVSRPPVNLTLVLDRSGSMSGDKIVKAREAAIAALRSLDPQDLFSLVIYDHNVQTLVPPQSAANTEWIESRVRSINPGGNTALYGAVSQGAAEVRKNLSGPYVHRIVLLSDGLANVGPSSPGDLARLGAALIKEGISVTTIGIGNDFNEDLMSQLADRSDGNHYFVESSRDLPRIFAAELGDVLSVAARKIVIEIDCPEGVRPLRIIGREGRIRDNRVEIHLNQLYGGQEKYVLIEVQVDAGREDAVQKIADARCSYENALTNKPESSMAVAQVRFSKLQEEVRGSASKVVQQALVENEMAEARDKALDLYNAGRKDEAVQQLKEKSDEISTRNQALGFSDIAAEAEGALQDDADTFAAPAPMAPAEKKSIRSESYKVRKQQKDY